MRKRRKKWRKRLKMLRQSSKTVKSRERGRWP